LPKTWFLTQIWKFSKGSVLCYDGIGYVGQVGTITVDATTGDIIPISAGAIQAMQERAHDLIVHFAPAAESAG
jgi:hypothetical protein